MDAHDDGQEEHDMTPKSTTLRLIGAAVGDALADDAPTPASNSPGTVPAPRGLKPWHWLVRESLVHGAPGIRALAVLLLVMIFGVVLVTHR